MKINDYYGIILYIIAWCCLSFLFDNNIVYNTKNYIIVLIMVVCYVLSGYLFCLDNKKWLQK